MTSFTNNILATFHANLFASAEWRGFEVDIPRHARGEHVLQREDATRLRLARGSRRSELFASRRAQSSPKAMSHARPRALHVQHENDHYHSSSNRILPDSKYHP